MAYTPPLYNVVNIDLKPFGSGLVEIPPYNFVNINIATDDGAGQPDTNVNSENARIRNFAILLCI